MRDFDMFFKCTLLLFVLAYTSFSAEPMTKESVLQNSVPYTGEHVPGVDTTTLTGKVMCGYQGWFSAEGDGSNRGWEHYGNRKMGPGNITIDLWPDVSELSDSEKYKTRFVHSDGSPAYLFSSYNKETVERHFKWMQDYGIDGVFLQRFATTVKSVDGLNKRNQVTSNVQSGANKYGRTWAMMYDLSGLKKGDIKSVLMEDWKMLVDRMKILEDKSYLRHKGKPVISIWGIGFTDRDYTLEECYELIKFLKTDEKYGQLTVMIGIPSFWRTLARDAVNDKLLHDIIESSDIISPWTVGRYRSSKTLDRFIEETVVGDRQWLAGKKIDYLPVIFPGFSWQNLSHSRGEEAKLNHIPRENGQFLWRQATTHVQNKADMLYVAMFDEVDEGTAIFKCTNNPPVGASAFMTYEGLPSDHYLWLTGQIKEMLNGTVKATPALPLRK
jgi:hypothetical protein